jgi:hypothetical protein
MHRRQRSLWLVALATLLSLGFYLHVWLALTWAEMKEELRDTRMSPVWHSLTALIPLYGLVVIHRHYGRIETLLRSVDVGVRVYPTRVVLGLILTVGPLGTGLLALFLFFQALREQAGPLLPMSLTGLAVLSGIVAHGQNGLNAYWSTKAPCQQASQSLQQQRPRAPRMRTIAAGLTAIAGLDLVIFAFMVSNLVLAPPPSVVRPSELEIEYEQLTPYPGATLRYYNVMLPRLVTSSYANVPSWEAYRSHYELELARNGWIFVREQRGPIRREVMYCKNGMALVLEYPVREGVAPDTWFYGLSVTRQLYRCP